MDLVYAACGALLAGAAAFAYRGRAERRVSLDAVRTADDAVRAVRSLHPDSTDHLVDMLFERTAAHEITDATAERLGALLERVSDPLGEQAFALTVLYSVARIRLDDDFVVVAP